MPINLPDLYLSRDIAAERIVLSKIITSRMVLPEIEESFFDGQERKLFEAIKLQWDKNNTIDIPILKKDYKHIIEECLDFSGSNSDHAVDILRDHATKRNFAKEVMALEFSDIAASEVITEFQSKISGIIYKKKSEYNHNESIRLMIDALEKAHANKNSIAGYSTGLSRFDSLIGGIEKKKVYAIGALKKTGKSRFGVYLSCKLKESGAGILWNSLEMSDYQLNVLATSFFSGLDSSIFGKEMPKRDYMTFSMALGMVAELDWSIYKEHTVSGLKSRILSERLKKPVDVVIIDFVQRMRSSEKHKSRADEIDRISQDLADLSRDLNVALIEFSQLNGEAEKLDKEDVPDVQHYKESQGIPENADVNIILHNQDRHDNPFNNDGSYRIQNFKMRVIQRYGVSGAILPFFADLRNCRFTESMENQNGNY